MEPIIPENIDSKFRYVLLAARRAEQLMRGARPRVETGARKPTVVAMREVSRGAVQWGYGPAPQDSVEEAPEPAETA
ncbi:MAG TPA: DNA-directed RNA polymerase subunit omega [Thermoanaerobaculia bacterium]|nr:DNA-directed RNA polymerase subunit omega [Thermoanaerobaculia bacterium]